MGMQPAAPIAASGKQQAASGKQQAASSKQQAASSKQQAASSKQQAASSKQQAASSKQQITRSERYRDITIRTRSRLPLCLQQLPASSIHALALRARRLRPLPLRSLSSSQRLLPLSLQRDSLRMHGHASACSFECTHPIPLKRRISMRGGSEPDTQLLYATGDAASCGSR